MSPEGSVVRRHVVNDDIISTTVSGSADAATCKRYAWETPSHLPLCLEWPSLASVPSHKAGKSQDSCINFWCRADKSKKIRMISAPRAKGTG